MVTTPQAEALPPSLEFDLDWASPSEREEIMSQMRALGRQTMNLRVMPKSRLLRIRAPNDGNKIVGWAGLDAWYTPGMAEFFSLYVMPDYRAYMVGLILETARCAFLLKECTDVKKVLVRMEASSNTSLLRYRLGSELMIEAGADELSADTLALCKECELYKKSCERQAFLWVDIQRFLERGFERIGRAVTTENLPERIALDPSRMRKAPRPLHAEPGPQVKGRQLDQVE
jgi:hypothetical protein